jgi:tol-pal system protein YbgF
LKTALSKKIASLGLAVVLSSGCYSTKMMEITYQELDTVKTQQQELMQKVDELSQQFDVEREARLQAEAERALALMELRELVEVLSYRFDDIPQLLEARTRVRALAAPDTARISQPYDSTGVMLPDSTAMVTSDGDSDAEKLFKSSYMDLTLGNYDLAIQGFKNFLVRYPNAENLASAHYYLGESYYSMSRYLEAVAEFQTVIQDNPRSRYAPPSYLKSGYCYQQLGESQLAERAFRELISIYPRSEEAEQARIALQEQGG